MTDDPSLHDPDAPPRAPIDAATIARAEALLRGAARGNGLISGQIKAAQAEGEVFNFEGLAFFRIEPKMVEKRVPGKEKGTVLGSAADMRAKMQAAIEKAATNPEVRRHTIQVLKKRRDLGVLTGNLYVTLDKLRQNFVVHEGCAPCGHNGRTTCQHCGGKGTTTCRKCMGAREMPCTLCRGTRVISTPKGQAQCTRCYGRGRMPCTQCRNMGQEICQACKKSGQIACQNCNGTGWHSLVGMLEIKAKSAFDYDRAALPPEIAATIDDLGPRLVTENHAQARIVEEEGRYRQLETVARPDEYIIAYHLRLPAGKIHFAMPGKESITARLFGYTPLLTDVPRFLEKPLDPALKALAQAAAGRAGELRTATRARFVAETVLTTLRHSRRKAAVIMRKRYPFGVGEACITQAVQDAAHVLAHIVNRPRAIGLAIGAAVAAGLFAAYFAGPGRALAAELTAAKGLAADVMTGVDGAVLLAGMLLCVFTAQGMATHGVRRALGPIAAKIPAGKLAPQSTVAMLAAMLLSLMLFIGFIEGAAYRGKTLPAWYAQARAQLVAAPPQETAAQVTE